MYLNHKKSSLILFVVLSLLLGCKRSVNKVSVIENDQNLLEETPKDTIISLKFDWFKAKQNIRFLNANNIVEKEKIRLKKTSNNGFLYGYSLFNGNQVKEQRNSNFPNNEKVIEAIVYKNTKKIGLYSEKNEDFLFIQSKVKNSNLQDLDIVGVSKNQIDSKFWHKRTVTNGVVLYKNKDSLLVCKFDNQENVLWFKFYTAIKYKEEDKKITNWN